MLQICSCFHYMCILLGLSLQDPWMQIIENTDLQCQSSKSISNPVQIVLSRIMQPIKDSKAWKMRIRLANASSSRPRGSLGHWSEIEEFGQHVWESMIAHFYRKIIHFLLLSRHCLQVDGLETPQWTFSNLQNPLRPFFHQVAECSTLATTELLRVPVQNSMSEAHLTKHWHTLAYSKADGNTWHACICIHIALAKPRYPKPTFLLYPFNLKCLKRRQWINKWQHNKQPMAAAMRFFCVRHFFWTVKVPK